MRPGKIDPEVERLSRDGLQAALDASAAILRAGGSAVDAVEEAARMLEEDPCFNAGRGSVLGADGHIELDAAIMDGENRRAGAVAGLRTTRNPIHFARHLLDNGPHVFLSGRDADEYARSLGLEQVANQWFETAERRRQLKELLASGGFDEEVKYGTIGAVAVDTAGHVAAATSTGGLTAKQWGRIGDSPLIGAGTYADDAAAISATGSGEYFIRTVAAHSVAVRVRQGAPVQNAVDDVLADIFALGGKGGMIAVTPAGDAAFGFTTPAMFRGIAGPDESRVAVYADSDER